jgi:hypothetical protein
MGDWTCPHRRYCGVLGATGGTPAPRSPGSAHCRPDCGVLGATGVWLVIRDHGLSSTSCRRCSSRRGPPSRRPHLRSHPGGSRREHRSTSHPEYPDAGDHEGFPRKGRMTGNLRPASRRDAVASPTRTHDSGRAAIDRRRPRRPGRSSPRAQGGPVGVTLWRDTPGVSRHTVTPRAMIVAMSDFRWNQCDCCETK